MGKDYFLYEKLKAERIGIITFNKPEKLNMISITEDAPHFRILLREIEQDDDIKVLILRGAGGNLGAGADMTNLGTETVGFSKDPKSPRPSLKKRLLYDRRMNHDNIDGISILSNYHFVKPCICQAQGYCYGWHFAIAAESDIIIAAEDALFTSPAFRYTAEVFQGQTLLNVLGYQRYAELLFTGKPFTAKEMQVAGMVNSVVPVDKLNEEVMEYASMVAKLSLEILMVNKHYLQTLRSLYHETMTSNLIATFTHLLSTYVKTEPDDYVVLKEVGKKGPEGAIKERESKYPPRWRLSLEGRNAKE
jgi:enoyl-CoA hydratase